MTEEEKITCSMCGQSLESDPELVASHYKEKHPLISGPGAAEVNATNVNRYSDDFRAAMRIRGETLMKRDREREN